MIFHYVDNSLPLKGKGAFEKGVAYLSMFNPVVAEIEADSITEADKLLFEFCKIKVLKAPHIACSILKEFTFIPIPL